MSQLLSQTTSQNNVLAMESNLYAQIGVFICKMLFKGANFCGRGFPKQEKQPELCMELVVDALQRRLRKASFCPRKSQMGPSRPGFLGIDGATGQASAT